MTDLRHEVFGAAATASCSACVRGVRTSAPPPDMRRTLDDCVVALEGTDVVMRRRGLLVEKVRVAGQTVTAVGFTCLAPPSDDPGAGERACITYSTAATASSPPVVVMHLPVGPILARMPAWAAVDALVGVPGCGLLIAGRSTGGDRTLAHTPHPLTLPQPVNGAWASPASASPAVAACAAPLLVHAVRSAATASSLVFVLGTAGGRSQLSFLEARPLPAHDTVERQVGLQHFTARGGRSVGDALLPNAPGSGGGAGRRLLSWTAEKADMLVVVSPADGALEVVSYDGPVLPFVENAAAAAAGSARVAVVDAAVCGARLAALVDGGGGARAVRVYATPVAPLLHLSLTAPAASVLTRVSSCPVEERLLLLHSAGGGGGSGGNGGVGVEAVKVHLRASPRCSLTRAALDLVSGLWNDPALWAGLACDVLAQPTAEGEWAAFAAALRAFGGGGGDAAAAEAQQQQQQAAPPLSPMAQLRAAYLRCPASTPLLRAAAAAAATAKAAAQPPHPLSQASPPATAADLAAVTCVLHVLHEGMRVSVAWRHRLERLGALLFDLASRQGWLLWAEYYAGLYPALHVPAAWYTAAGGVGAQPPLANNAAGAAALAMVARKVRHAGWFAELGSPPDVFAYAHAGVSLRRPPTRAFPYAPASVHGSHGTASARVLLHLVDLRHGLSGERYFAAEEGGGAASSSLSACAVSAAASPPRHEAGSAAVLEAAVSGPHAREVARAVAALSLGPALLLLQAAAAGRERPPAAWGPRLLAAVGRQDAARLASGGYGGGGGSLSCLTLQPLGDFEDLRLVQPKPPRAEASCITDATLGVDVGNGPPSIGHRLLWGKDARLAAAQTLLCSAVPIVLSSGDDDLTDPAAQQQQLAAVANRVLALPCGRGMLTLTTMRNLSGSALPLPPIVLCGRRAKDQVFTSLDLSGYAADTTLWPEFLNGCSAALRLQTLEQLGTRRMYIRDWIANAVSPNAAPTAATAGVVLGLGLLGHLEYLTSSELYYLMFPLHEATTVALLLGLSACHRGTGEKRIGGILSLHLTPITPHNSEQDVPPCMQAAALIGTGLLYQGTCHRLMSDMLLGELSRPPSDEHSTNLHSYALCTGFALGLTCLCKGGEASHLADLRLTDRLLSLLTCTKRELLGQHGGGGSGSGRGSGPVRAGEDGPGTGIPRSMHRRADPSQHCSKVLVGPLVDTNVAAPAAAAALGLLFMRSDNEVVHAALRLPATASLLLSVSPDAALVRTIAAALVRWESIEATHAWVDSMIPDVMHKTASVPKQGAAAAAAGRPEPQHVHAGMRAHLLLLHANAVAAGAFALGLRFAGSENVAARDVVLAELAQLTGGKVGRGETACPLYADEATANKRLVEPAVNAMILAAACIMAGTGCAQVFGTLRALQRRKDASYGSHMAVAMAIGLLFLGAGHRTLSTSPQSTAALFVSLYPRFPTVATDNTYHPQFLRPLYALATIPRILETKDVDTGETCPVSLVINGRTKATSPCVLPRGEHVTVEVCGKGYYPAFFSKAVPGQKKAIESGILWVKKRTHVSADGVYDACFGEGPLRCSALTGGEPSQAHHAVASAAAAAGDGAAGLRDVWDVKLALAAVEAPPALHGPSRVQVLCRILPSYIRAFLDKVTAPLLPRSVRLLLEHGSREEEEQCSAWRQALAWHGLPASRLLLQRVEKRRLSLTQACPLASPEAVEVFLSTGV